MKVDAFEARLHTEWNCPSCTNLNTPYFLFKRGGLNMYPSWNGYDNDIIVTAFCFSCGTNVEIVLGKVAP